jgi:hypothetical protein
MRRIPIAALTFAAMLVAGAATSRAAEPDGKAAAAAAAPAPSGDKATEMTGGCMPGGGCCGNGACAQAATAQGKSGGSAAADGGCPCRKRMKAKKQAQ